MLPKETIAAFISAIDSRIPPPVHTAGIQNSRPVPAVLIQNMTIDEKNYHNSYFAGSEYDDAGNVSKEIFRHYYDLRLELVVKDDDETQAFDYLGDLKQAIAEVGRDPCGIIHDHVNEVRSGGSGGMSYQFYEPTETEINQSVVLKTFYESTEENPDTLQNIGSEYNFS
jgi:hypothetical protein